MKKGITKLLTGAALSLGLIAGAAQAADPLKVGFVYVGPVGDHGWSYQHDQGRLAIEKHFGDKVETTFVESVPEGADAERVIRNLAKSGNELIFTTSFGYMNPTLKVAKAFKNVTFEHATGYKTAKNAGNYLSKTFEGRYVAGFAAAKMTKSNKIGYIASFPIPEVIRDINTVQLALNKYNPEAELKIIWVNSWFDPGKEADAANAMIDQGVDVILQHTDSPAAMQVADRRGVYAVGQASDMSSFGPKAHLLSVVDDWAALYIRKTQEVLDKTWKPESYWGGMAEKDIIIPEFTNMPEEIAKEAQQIIDDTISGKFYAFTGPIKNQAGEIMVKEGEAMPLSDLLGINWYVEGIKGDIPK